MIEHPKLVPIGVAVAVLIFVGRELLEAFRRWKANRRKVRAMRRMIAAECERNFFARSRILEALGKIMDESISLVRVVKDATGWDEFRWYRDEIAGSFPLPEIRTAVIDKLFFEAASIAPLLFERCEQALDGLYELTHVLRSLRANVAKSEGQDDDDQFGPPPDQLLADFASWARQHVEQEFVPVAELYRHCTGKALEHGRVR